MFLLVLIKNASITSAEMAWRLSVDRRTIQRGLDVLKGKQYGAKEVNDTDIGKFTNSFCIPIVPLPDRNVTLRHQQKAA
ncbi:MAG: HTH domain-containing protein [Lachnospiraceae bacterium]|jgi:hypothetical protein|nr:HTH domain-containing protein [Lachnospiraceae bacterium]